MLFMKVTFSTRNIFLVFLRKHICGAEKIYKHMYSAVIMYLVFGIAEHRHRQMVSLVSLIKSCY